MATSITLSMTPIEKLFDSRKNDRSHHRTFRLWPLSTWFELYRDCQLCGEQWMDDFPYALQNGVLLGCAYVHFIFGAILGNIGPKGKHYGTHEYV
jgi:hypothetical protein